QRFRPVCCRRCRCQPDDVATAGRAPWPAARARAPRWLARRNCPARVPAYLAQERSRGRRRRRRYRRRIRRAHTGSRHSRQRARSVALAIARRNLAAVPSPAPRARDDSPTELPGRLGGFGHAGRKHRANSRPVPRPSQEAARSPRRNESAAHGRGCVMAEPAFEPLLAELRNVVDQADPIPEPVVAAAKAVFTWRTIDAELAELVADSFVTAAGTRTADAARLLTFQADDTEVEVEIAATGATRRITGQLVPPGP